MKKITTLFKKDPNDLGRVINEISPENAWALNKEISVPTRKYDGTACAIINGILYKRYDAKPGKKIPEGAIPCQEPDEITRHWPHWVKCNEENPEDRWHFEGLRQTCDFLKNTLPEGTYELLGEKINNNPEKMEGHYFVPHGSHVLHGLIYPLTFEGIKNYLEKVDIEGIVFHNKITKEMCKIRKKDFGLKR